MTQIFEHLPFQLLDEVEQNILICQWRADQLFAEAETHATNYPSTTEHNLFTFKTSEISSNNSEKLDLFGRQTPPDFS